MSLSDKELDRLSREAAYQHDPGDLVGPRSWDRLEFRLDKELGKLGPSPVRGIRGIRRIPFYYVSAILLLAGVSYYLVKHGKGNAAKTEPSGSPPLTAVPTLSPAPNHSDSSTKMLNNSPNSTRPDKELTVQYPTSAPATATTPGTGSATPLNTGVTPAPGADTRATASSAPGARSPSAVASNKGSGIDRTVTAPTGSHSSITPRTSITPHTNTHPEPAATAFHTGAAKTGAHHLTGSTAKSSHTGRNQGRKDRSRYLAAGQTSGQDYAAAGQDQEYAAKDPSRAYIQSPHSLARSGRVDDSALKAFAAKGAPVATPIRLGKKKEASLHINRPLSIGFSLSPDFASVHSMAGDRPGSSIGLTMDYEILNRLHIGTGLLLTRKNYAATPENYHVPKDYYRINNPSAHDINLVKGSFYMLEIPLNLRYDFSVSGNTLFFISGGASSYLLTSEHSQYYFNYFGRQACLNFNPRSEAGSRNYLFASVDLSAGVETGISNSLSLLIAPYVKLPARGMGFGQVQLTSVGVNFALKFSPVLSRKRK